MRWFKVEMTVLAESKKDALNRVAEALELRAVWGYDEAGETPENGMDIDSFTTSGDLHIGPADHGSSWPQQGLGAAERKKPPSKH